MSSNIVELITYATSLGDPKLMGLMAQAMGEIEACDNPAKKAKASRIAAFGGMVIAPSVMIMNSIRDTAKEGKALIQDIESKKNK